MTEQIRDAVILAAGLGLRMREKTAELPKALLDLGSVSIIRYQISALRHAGIDRITVVTGYAAETVREHLADEHVQFVHNEVYDTTNSLYSLCLAREVLHGGALSLNADVVFHFDLLTKILNHPAANAVLVDFENRLEEEEMKVCAKDGIVTEISKTITPTEGMGENVGIIKIGAAAAPAFLDAAEGLFAEGQLKAWAPRAVDLLVGEVPFHALPVGGMPWTEVDFPEDLEYARDVVFPACKAGVV